MSINSHIEQYLDYYLSLTHPPRFAVLLHGEWGAGKTWFIKDFIERYVNNKKQEDSYYKAPFLFISLYGLRDISWIDDQIFQQLHPILSHKSFALAGNILKGILRTTIKIELSHDKKEHINISSKIPDIPIVDYLKNVDDRIIIFDDLERSSLPIKDVFGYINTFVEHQGLKCIVIANEGEILQKIECAIYKDYNRMKEKVIGKTFQVNSDAQSSFHSFVSNMNYKDAKKFITTYKEEILHIFYISTYNNLRYLQQSFLDFERLFMNIGTKYMENLELMGELLSIFLAFSIEIKRGAMIPEDIKGLQSAEIRKRLGNYTATEAGKPKVTGLGDTFWGSSAS